MNKQQRYLILIGFLAISVLAGWPPAARANVTLVSFTAMSVPPAPEIYVQWETATQLDTVGFFVTRSDSKTGEYTRVSDYIEREGDDLTGWKYDPWIDEDVVLGRTYWYKLEELTTNQSSLFYGPISAVAGALPTATATLTPTPTRTPTRTPTATPTATPTGAPSEPATNPTASTGNPVVATPRAVSAATVTPRPDTTGGSAAPATIAPVANAPAEVQTQSQPQAQPPAEMTSVPSAPDAAVSGGAPAAAEAAPSAAVSQAPDPTLAPPDAVPAVSAPAVVVTEAAPATSTAPTSSNTPVLLLVGAAFVFLGIAFFILRQGRS
jgi:hypothetical protein